MVYEGYVYKEVAGFPDYYVRKSNGQVISTKKARNIKAGEVRLLAPTINSSGYLQLCLRDSEGTVKNVQHHRVMMLTFVPNPDDKPYVNHIDGNTQNNDLNNLEWCTPKENTVHAHSTGLIPESTSSVSIHQYALTGEHISSFGKIRDASSKLGIKSEGIVCCAKGRTLHAGGFLFSYNLLERVPAYSGLPITKEILVRDVETGVTVSYETLAAAAKSTNLHRSKFLRRFKKSYKFYIEHFHVEKVTY